VSIRNKKFAYNNIVTPLQKKAVNLHQFKRGMKKAVNLHQFKRGAKKAVNLHQFKRGAKKAVNLHQFKRGAKKAMDGSPQRLPFIIRRDLHDIIQGV